MSHWRFDLHLHTEYSSDCDTSLAAIEPHCVARGIAGIAVTDHNSIEGALRLRDSARQLRVIVGEEVSTRDGDLIGLFLRQRIPPRMPACETIDAIHAQGGIVYLPHPFDRRRARRSEGASLSHLIPGIDVVEILNGKAGRDRYNLLAAEFALRHGIVGGGGSDAHSLQAIGSVAVEFEAPFRWDEPAEFLEHLATAKIAGVRRSPIGGVLIRGRRPFRMAFRRLRQWRT